MSKRELAGIVRGNRAMVTRRLAASAKGGRSSST